MRFSLLACLFVLWLNMGVSLQTEPLGCSSPPLLADGDIRHTMKSHYSHNERAEYVCQTYYVMEGEPYRTCINGEWTGEQRCLKPCTVNDDHLRQHNINFRYTNSRKMYANHNDVIEFSCTKGRAVGSMRQRCTDGVIPLPSCQ